MESNLHVIYPAAEYVPGGTIEAVALNCLQGEIVLKNKIQRVILQITESPFSVEEVSIWGPGCISATKIIDACTLEVTYVKEYFIDVQAAQDCCIINLPQPEPEPLNYYWGWFDFDPLSQIMTDDNLIYQGHDTEPLGAAIVRADYRTAPLFRWLVLKRAAAQPLLTSYANSLGIFGPLGDPVIRDPFTVGDWDYIVSRIDLAFDKNSYTFFNS